MKKILLLVLLCISLQTVRGQVPVNATDSLALIDLYNKTSGSQWVGILGWKQSNGPVSSWSGVTVVNGRVTSLNLEGFGLRDSLPSTIGNLTALTSLRIGSNPNLKGSIPPSIGRLTNLALLDMSQCSFTGSIPDSIGYLVKDTLLNLAGNQLSGSIPATLSNLTKVKTIYLQTNNLTGTIPSSFSNLTSLEILWLAYNQLSGSVPTVLGNIPNLQVLELDHNQFTGGVPTFLNKITNLKKLYLSANQLSGSIPNSLSNFSNLVELFLDRNSLSGTIPDSLGFTTNLTTLYLDSNNLVEPFPKKLAASTTLKLLNIQRNYFTFASLENLASNHSINSSYASQRIRIPIHQVGNTLSVAAGGTLSNNTYKWYKIISNINTPLVATKYGDSTFTVTAPGVYFAQITNAIASKVTLYSNSDTITKLVTAPTLTSFSPNFGPAGTIVTIKGSSFTGTASVTFGNVAASSFTIVDDSTITAIVGNGAKGNVAVYNGIGTASKGTFYYCAAPVNKSKNIGGCTSLLYNGVTYTTSTTINDTLKNVLGCDSVYNTVSISITPIVAVIKPATLYGCTKVVYNGKTYTVSTIINDTIKSVWGCDSVYNVVTITISPVVAVTKPVTLRGCNSLVYNGKTYTTPTVVKDTTKSVGGCDSVYNIVTITFGKPTSSTVTASFCSGDGYLFNGTTYYNSAGTYIVHLTNAAGCDSTITLNLNSTTSPSFGTATITQPTCSSTLGSIVVNNYRGYQAFAGSLDTTDAKQTGMIVRSTASTCAGKSNPGLSTTLGSRYYDSYTFKNNTGNPVCVYTNLVSYNTSAINLVVYNGSFNPSNPSTNYLGDIGKANLGTTSCEQTVAAGATFVVVIHALNANSAIGAYKFEIAGFLTPEYSIDSGATWQSSNTFNSLQAGDYNLFVRLSGTNCATAYFNNPIKIVANSNTASAPNTITFNHIGCNSVEYLGKQYTASTIVLDTVHSYQGCDSIYNVHNITVNKITPTTDSKSFTSCSSIVYNGKTYNSSTSFVDTLKSVQGCDSVYKAINITINYIISGRIISSARSAINKVLFIAKNGNIVDSSIVKGSYFDSCLAPQLNVVIKLSKTNDSIKGNGITGLDLFHLQNHLLNKTKLNSPYKLIAADVDGSKSIGGLDLFYLKKFLLGSITTFPNNRLWAFVDSAYVFPDTTNPFPFKDSISFTNLSGNKTNQTFIGVKLGDLNFDWNPALARGAATKPVELVYHVISTKEKSNQVDFSGSNLRNDEQINIPITVKNFKDLVAMQYTLHFDNSKYEFVGIENNKLDIEFNNKQATQNGNISFVWTDKNADEKTLNDGSKLFSLVLKAHHPSSIDHSNKDGLSYIDYGLSLTNDITDIAAWDKDLNQHNIILSKIVSNKPQTINEIAIHPNPAHSSFTLNIKTLVGAGSIVVTDLFGKQIKIQSLSMGSNNVDVSNLSKGFYLVSIITSEGKTTKKLVVE